MSPEPSVGLPFVEHHSAQSAIRHWNKSVDRTGQRCCDLNRRVDKRQYQIDLFAADHMADIVDNTGIGKPQSFDHTAYGCYRHTAFQFIGKHIKSQATTGGGSLQMPRYRYTLGTAEHQHT